MSAPVDISVIVPVLDGGPAFARCLQALCATDYPGPWELLVVDDGSTDSSASLAHAGGARVVPTNRPHSGPAAARNLGAAQAVGDILLFLDADVLAKPGTVQHAVAFLNAHGQYAAIFGSYDDAPACRGFLSQVKNLFHHYTHQVARSEASTFWAGCGAIRQTAFWDVGGFDSTRYPRPAVEDIELGVRLRRHGYGIYLDKTWQVTHQKCWTARAWLQSDLMDRGIPWWRLILETQALPNDLNVDWRTRAAVGMTGLLATSLVIGVWIPQVWSLTIVIVLGLLGLGWPWYRWLAQQRGGWFALCAIPWHWVYHAVGGLSVVAGTAQWVINRLNRNEDLHR